MPPNKHKDTFARLKQAEESFLKQEFLAPVTRGGKVRVKVSGISYELSITPPDFTGFGVFRPTTHRTAEYVRDASLSERGRYLTLFPEVKLVLCFRDKDHWFGIPANRGDTRFRITGVVPIIFADEGEQFETVSTRFDGKAFWFERVDSAKDPSIAAYLRTALHSLEDSANLSRPGLTPEEKAAYAVNFVKSEEEVRKCHAEQTEDRLRSALAHAGAELRGFLERDDVYRISYSVDGREHTSAISKEDLTVESAGICLDGMDRDFDLQSLVGVLREAAGTGQLNWD